MSKKILSSLYGVLGIILLWYILSFIVGDNMVPTPIETLKETINLFQKGFILHVVYSFYRVLCAIIISLIIGIPLGILLGTNKKIDNIISPTTYLLYPIPKIAFLPIFMVLFGIGETSKIILMITIIVFQIIIVTKDGVSNIDKDILVSAKVMKFSKVDMLTKIIVPSIAPNIFSALRVSIGIAISALFFSENYATRYGLGYYIMNAWSMVDYKGMFAGILVLSLLSLLIFKGIDLIEKYSCPWNRK